MDKPVDKLPIFKTNDLKKFKFTIEQYVLLEIEYNRNTIYKELVKNIENILKINDNHNDYLNTNRKLYENKNILDRFILECINDGISPNININNNPQPENMVSTILTDTNGNMSSGLNEPEMNVLYRYLLFNKKMGFLDELRDCVYYKKMISEYNEKKIKVSPEKIIKIERAIMEAHNKFINVNNLLVINKNKLNVFQDINCNILVTAGDKYIITYRNYSKVINFKRYAKLIKNYDRPFPYDILRMILRYSIFDTSNQQWSIGINLYENIGNIFDISFEMFASPLNFNMNMFCSIFLDTDKVFGSVGSFYNLTVDKILNQNIRGVFFNPPYLPILMNYTTKICIQFLEKMEKENIDFTIVSFLPNWADADYIKLFLKSNYLVSSRVVNKGDYILHEKDKGKLIRGTFELLVIVMNSKKSKWDNSRSAYFQEGFNNILKIMKEETHYNNIDT